MNIFNIRLDRPHMKKEPVSWKIGQNNFYGTQHIKMERWKVKKRGTKMV